MDERRRVEDVEEGVAMKKTNKNKVHTVSIVLNDPPQYDVMMVTPRGDVRIGMAFEVSTGEVVADLSALPVGGQIRLRKVTL
jgi:hypothetical protein